MKRYTADLIFTLTGEPLKDHVITTDDDGTILSIDSIANHDSGGVKAYKGIISPGFVNTHCHLELSHMKGLVNTGTGGCIGQVFNAAKVHGFRIIVRVGT